MENIKTITKTTSMCIFFTSFLYLAYIFYNLCLQSPINWSGIGTIVNSALFLIAFISVIFVYFGYNQSIKKDKIDRTTEILNNFFILNINKYFDQILQMPPQQTEISLELPVTFTNKENQPEHQKNRDAIYSTLQYFEMTGMLLKKDLIDFEMVYQTFSLDIPQLYKRLEEYIKRVRTPGNETGWENFEKLYFMIKTENESKISS